MFNTEKEVPSLGLCRELKELKFLQNGERRRMFEYYAIRIYCEDCLGDNMGCFCGGWAFARWEDVKKEQEDNKEGIIVVDFKSEAEKILDLLEEAKNPISWRYEIVEVNIEAKEVSNA